MMILWIHLNNFSLKYKKVTYNDVKTMNKYYDTDTIHKYSSALDILASYIKCQNNYMEARFHVTTGLNFLMLPCIFLSAACSVLAPISTDYSWGEILMAATNAFISFILAIINFLKLDAAGEAHKISSHQYDKLQSFVEFSSGEVLLFSHPILSKGGINHRWDEYNKGLLITAKGLNQIQIQEQQRAKYQYLLDVKKEAEYALLKDMKSKIQDVEKIIEIKENKSIYYS